MGTAVSQFYLHFYIESLRKTCASEAGGCWLTEEVKKKILNKPKILILSYYVLNERYIYNTNWLHSSRNRNSTKQFQI